MLIRSWAYEQDDSVAAQMCAVAIIGFAASSTVCTFLLMQPTTDINQALVLIAMSFGVVAIAAMLFSREQSSFPL